MAKKRTLRKFEDVAVEQLRNNPDMLGDYLQGVFEDYQGHRNTSALMTALGYVIRADGVSKFAERIGMTRQELHKAISDKGNLNADNFMAIMQGLGGSLTFHPDAGYLV